MDEKVITFAAVKEVHNDTIKAVTDYFSTYIKNVIDDKDRTGLRKVLKEELTQFKD
jgi:flagellar motor component MotA